MSEPNRPHSSNSDPLNFLKKRHNDIKKSTLVFSEELDLKEQIEQLKTRQKKLYAGSVALSEQLKNYKEHCLQAIQRRDDKLIELYKFMIQRDLTLIQENGRTFRCLYEEQKDLNKRLQKLEAQKT